jgi:pimeloyl-[acyl-carrier protein] methyl ester esterase
LVNKRLTPTLVLLPGLDGTGLLFRAFVEALSPHVETQVVTYPVDQRLGYAELEGLVRAALPTHRPYVVLGESFSGPIAIRLAAGRPGADPPAGMVGLILCVTFAKNPHPLLAWMAPWASGVPVEGLPAWLRAPFMWGGWSADREPLEVQRATAAVDESVLRHRIAAVLAVDETSALARIRMPTLVLRASADHVVPRAASEHVLRVLPAAELVEVEGPHLLLQMRPAECAAVVRRFLRMR